MRTKIIALLLLLSCIGGVFAQTADDWYQNKPVRAVTFEGLKNVARSELDGLFTSYLGEKFTDELYWDILQKLYALEYFETITPMALPGDPDRKTVKLQFTVIEKPVIKDIVFDGNNKLHDTELLEKVTLKEGDIYNELKSRMDERALRDFYLEKGYANIKVSSEARTNANSTISLHFSITEGKQTVVSSIKFEGNKVMAAKTLRNAMSLKETTLLNSGNFRESQLEADKAAIRSYYTERGYVDATVESVLRETDTETNAEKNLLKLTFVISEGEQYTYGGTTIEGNHIFQTPELLSRIRLREGDVMNQNKFDQGFQALADVYYENGYTSNYINRKEIRDSERKRISYVVTIAESERSHIEHIIIKGNTKTKDKVILREFSLEPGDIFSKSKLLDSVRNLYNLRYFSAVAPDLVPGSEQNLVDVVVALEEQSTASIQFGVTFSGVSDSETFPLSVFIQWEDKNFLGNGQTVSANVTASPDTQSVSLGFSENWFLGSPLTVSFNLSLSHNQLYAYQDSIYPIFNEDDPVPDPYTSYADYESASDVDDSFRMKYDKWSYGIGSSTGYRWSPSFATVTLRGGVNFSVVQNFYDDQLYRPADKSIREKHGSWIWSNSVWTRLSLDRRDINYDPSRGWFASQQLSYYGIIPGLETDYYTRFDTKLEGYLTLLDLPVSNAWNLKFVLAGYSGLSFQVPVGNQTIGDSNKLYIDGMFTGRGWSTLYSNGLKGNLLLSHWLELRMPIAPGVIAADFYLDAVALKDDPRDISSITLDDYYFSFGPGLRFSIPQFPLRLMFANTFRVQNGQFKWDTGDGNADGAGPAWKFVLSFNIANL